MTKNLGDERVGVQSTAHRYLPAWDVVDLPQPKTLSWRHWTSFLGPGIVMMGIQIGGGEWLYGPEVTAKYGGSLMWIATIAIVLQVFYNLECGRYALYCGEPVFTGFMRMMPGPSFWVAVMLLLNASAMIPGLSTHGAAIIASLWLDRPPGEEDRQLVRFLAFVCLFTITVPVLLGGKVYNMLQAVMTAKVMVVLGFCLFVGISFVPIEQWANVFSGFLKFGCIPVADGEGKEHVVNLFSHYRAEGEWPVISLSNIAILGAFAGYAGGGGLANSTYSNFVRDKGWGMGSLVGAIPSVIGGKEVALSHVGKVFPVTSENLSRWRGWWRYLLTDQLIVWMPGCFMGMALPALMSIEFAPYSPISSSGNRMEWAAAMVTADGLRHASGFGPAFAKLMWIAALITGMMVMLPSQMSILDDFSRRWTDAIWSANPRVRRALAPHQVKWVYYSILAAYLLWSFLFAYLFPNPGVMTKVIANVNNLAIGFTAFQLIWINHRLLPAAIRPRWYQTLGVLACGVFYLGLAVLVFVVNFETIATWWQTLHAQNGGH